MLDKLTAFEVEETNKTFFARDGVLYAIVDDGYVLVQYPAGKTDTEYRVLDGTVRIADSAFYQDKHLKKVTLPMSVKSVGAFAFYGSAVEEYVFEAVEAPILETSCILLDFTYISDQTSEECWVFSPFVGFQSTLYYANFGGFAGLIIEEEHYLSHLGRLEDNGANVDEYKNYTAPVFTHKLYRPENGQGYTSPIWLAYFSDANTTLTAYSADRTTQNAIDKISAIPTADEIQTAISALPTAAEKLARLNEISTQSLAGARTAYNAIIDDKQKDLITEYDKLLASEKMVRDLKAQSGSPVEVDRLERKGAYQTRYTAGDKFNPEGMTITAVFTDGSLIIITPEDYVLDKSVLTADDESVTLSYGGKSLKLAIQVSGTTPVDSDTDSTTSSGKPHKPSKRGCSSGASANVWASLMFITVAASVVMKKKSKKQ